LSEAGGDSPQCGYRNEYHQARAARFRLHWPVSASIGFTLWERALLRCCVTVMKNRYRLIRYGRRGGKYYPHDNETGLREGRKTASRPRRP